MPEITSKVSKQGPVKRSIAISVPPEQVEDERKRVYARLRPGLIVPGFRKGKAPDHVIAERYGDRVDEDVVHHLVEKACGEVIKAESLDAVVPPRVLSHEMDAAGGLSFEVEVEIRPEFKLKKDKGIKTVRKVVRIEDRHVDDYLASLRQRAAVLETEEERVNVAPGDIVVMDVSASLEGQKLDRYCGQSMQTELGAGRNPEEFDKQMVGITRAIPTPIMVPFAADHGDKDIAGRTVRFEVTVKEIKNKILPALDDDLPGELGLDDCETLDDLKSRLRKELTERSSLDADRRLRQELLDKMVGMHSFDVPEGMVNRSMLARLQGMGVRDIPEDRFEELRKALEPGAEKEVRAEFILDVVARSEQLEVSPDDLAAAVQNQVALAGERADEVRKRFSTHAALKDLEYAMLRDKALERVVELAKVSDEEVDESQVADSHQTG